MDLADVHQRAVDELHYAIAQLLDSKALGALGDVFDTISDHFEALTIWPSAL